MPAPDADGQVALMLCESILHILVEEGVISSGKALEAIDSVVELARENEVGQPRSASRSAVHLIEAIAQPSPLKDRTRLLLFRQKGGDDGDVRKYADELGLAAHAYFSQHRAQLGPRGRDLNPGICGNLTQFFPRQERRREPALSRRQTKEFAKLSLGGSARIRVGNKDHC
jgi:hypothetical protein